MTRPGDAPTHLVLLPGMDGTGDLFGPLLRALPEGVGTTVVSYPPDRLLGFADLARFVREATITLPPHVLVAESFSGPVAILHAATRPPNVLGLVLVATFARNPLPVRQRWPRLLAQPALFRVPPARAVLRAFLAGADATSELIDAVAAAIARTDPAVMAHRLREVLSADVTAPLASIRVPAMHLAASHDRLLGRRGRAQIAAALPAITTTVLEGPHLLLQTRPQAAAREILAFAKRAADAARPTG